MARLNQCGPVRSTYAKGRQQRSLPIEPKRKAHRSRTYEIRLPTSALQPLQSTLSSPNTSTLSASPDMTYDDARRDGLPLVNGRPSCSIYRSNSPSRLTDNEEQVHQALALPQSPRAMSQTSSRILALRPKSSRDEMYGPIDSLAKHSDLLTKSMIVQNYASGASKPNPPSKIDRTPSVKHSQRSRRRKKSAIQRHASICWGSTSKRGKGNNLHTSLSVYKKVLGICAVVQAGFS